MSVGTRALLVCPGFGQGGPLLDIYHLCILASAAEGQALAYYYSLRSHGAAVHLQQADDNVRRREGHLGTHDGLRVL